MSIEEAIEADIELDAAVDNLEQLVQGALPSNRAAHQFLPSNAGALARARQASRLRVPGAAACAPATADMPSDAPAQQYGDEACDPTQPPPPPDPPRAFEVPYALPRGRASPFNHQLGSHPSSPRLSSNSSLSASPRAIGEDGVRSPSPCHV